MRQLIGAMTIAFGLGLSGGAHAGIAGSSHDFTDNVTGRSGNSTSSGAAVTETGPGGWNNRGEICRVCHVPHDHNRTLYTQGLLWNHAASTVPSYTVYTSSTMDAATGQPQGRSKLCLGCHDGSVAVSAFDSGHATGSSTPLTITDPNNPGGTIANPNYVAPVFIGGASGQTYSSGYNVGKSGNLAGTHPISINYPIAGGKGIRALTAAPNWIGAVTVADTLENGRIECSTCHDVHSQNYAFSGTTHSHLLRQAQTVSQGGSASGLCLTCHDK